MAIKATILHTLGVQVDPKPPGRLSIRVWPAVRMPGAGGGPLPGQEDSGYGE